MVIKVINLNNRVYVFYTIKVIKSYSDLKGAIRAVEKREKITYKESSNLIRALMIANDKTQEERIVDLEEQLSRFNKSTENKQSAKVRRCIKRIEKEYINYMHHNEITHIKMCYYIRGTPPIKKNYLYKFIGENIDYIYNCKCYIEILINAKDKHKSKEEKLNTIKILKRHIVVDKRECRGHLFFLTHYHELLLADTEN